jgi:hypothetical protein
MYSMSRTGDVHSPSAFFFFFAFILHIHIFYFKVAHQELLAKGSQLFYLKVATFSSMTLPFLMLVVGEALTFSDVSHLLNLIGINIHVVVEYVVTVALALYIFSFRNDMSSFSLAGNYKISSTTSNSASPHHKNDSFQNDSERNSLSSSSDISSPLLR